MSQITPISTPDDKTNVTNNNDKIMSTSNSGIITQLKYMIILKSIFGINRTYLLKLNTVVILLCSLYSFILLISSIYLLFCFENEISETILKWNIIVQYIISLCLSITQGKNQIRKMLKMFNNVDKILNITNELRVSSSMIVIYIWIVSDIIFNLFEYTTVKDGFRITSKNVYKIILLFIANTAIDVEQIFFLALLQLVYKRVIILRAHIEKILNLQINQRQKNEIEDLSLKVNLDTSQLHQVYRMLHECCQLLSSVMDLPVSVGGIRS